jgi:hypothetical protein
MNIHAPRGTHQSAIVWSYCLGQKQLFHQPVRPPASKLSQNAREQKSREQNTFLPQISLGKIELD